VRVLGADRIGHGIRALEDPALAAELRERRVALEVCPTSNIATRCVPSLAAHPFPRLVEAGLLVTLNSDDPAMFSSRLAGEYEAARATFGFDDDALARLARAGIDASFAPGSLKATLAAEVAVWRAQHRASARDMKCHSASSSRQRIYHGNGIRRSAPECRCEAHVRLLRGDREVKGASSRSVSNTMHQASSHRMGLTLARLVWDWPSSPEMPRRRVLGL
jgi:Adenosine deaminase